MKIRLLCVLLLLLLAAAPVSATIEIDPDALPAWDKVPLTGRTTYVLDDTRDAAVYLPEGWVTEADESGIILVGSSPSALASIEDDGLAADEIAGGIFVLTEDLQDELGISGMEWTAEDLLNELIFGLIGTAETTYDEPLAIAPNDERILILPLQIPVNDGPAVDALAFVLEIDDTMVFAAFGFGAERTDTFSQAEVFAIVLRLRVMGRIESGDTELSESITVSSAELGTMTVRYPDGYVAADEGDGAFVIANSQQALDELDLNDNPTAAAIAPGQFAVLGLGFPLEFGTILGIAAGDEPGEGLAALLDMLAQDENDVTFDFEEPEALPLEGGRAATAVGTVSEGDVTNDAAFVLIEADGGYVLLLAFSAEGTIGEYDAVLRAIAASADYTPSDNDS